MVAYISGLHGAHTYRLPFPISCCSAALRHLEASDMDFAAFKLGLKRACFGDRAADIGPPLTAYWRPWGTDNQVIGRVDD